MSSASRPRYRIFCAAGGVLLALGACAPGPGTPVASALPSAVPPGSARIWFYRDYEPSVSLNLAEVSLNGAAAGYVQPDGSAFYRDVPPGHYHVTVASYAPDVNQSKDIDLGPGQEAFAKILAQDSWVNGGDTTSFKRDMFYVSLVPPQIARAQLGTRPLIGG